jgi:hypothetical protein
LPIAGGATVVALLALVVLANATTKTSSGIVNDQAKTFTAKCPRGERVDIGGFRSTVNAPSGILVEDLTFKRQRTWKARFDGLGNAAPAAAIAYCGHTARLIRKTKSATAPSLRGDEIPLGATATCPAGTSVQLGGFEINDSNIPKPRGGPPSGFRAAKMLATSARKWRVTGVAAPNVKLTAVAGCADLPAPDAVTKTVDVPAGGKTSAIAKCPQGSHVVMGGFRQSVFDGGGPYIRGLERPTRRNWKATTWEFDDPESLTAIAYCG